MKIQNLQIISTTIYVDSIRKINLSVFKGNSDGATLANLTLMFFPVVTLCKIKMLYAILASLKSKEIH